MDFELTEEQREFIKEVRDVLADEWRLLREKGIKQDVFPQEYYDTLAKRGWLTLNFPKEYTGREPSHWKQYIFLDELSVAAPEPIYTAAVHVPIMGSIIPHCTAELKSRILSGLLNGKLRFCLGYTEPDCGSDTAAIITRAVEDGDDYIINGTKIYNDAYQYDYILMTARTDINVHREKGISLFMVDLHSAGISIRPIWTFYGFRRNECNFEDVRVPKANLVGGKNQGWDYFMKKVLKPAEWSIVGVRQCQYTFDILLSYVKKAKREGKPLKNYPAIRYRLADLALEIQIGWLISNYCWWRNENKLSLTWEPAMSKLYWSELFQRICSAMIDIAGQFGQLYRSPESQKWLAMGGRPLTYYGFAQAFTVMGGTSEMQRNDIALLGLNLPGLEYWGGETLTS